VLAGLEPEEIREAYLEALHWTVPAGIMVEA
jgi:hypothetical protein